MASKFGANPVLLMRQGQRLGGQSQSFGRQVDAVFATIAEMLNTAYSSPAAAALAKEMEKFQPDLQKMRKVMSKYGMFCQNAGNKVTRNEDNIVSTYGNVNMVK